MGTDIIPYDPYHPHLGYTLLVAILAWLCVALYCRLWLKQQPRLRTMLYAVAIGLPIFGETTSYLIDQLRPAPNTPLGYVLTHFHAYVLQRIPMDTFLTPLVGMLLGALLVGLTLFSLARFGYGTWQLNRALADAAELSATEHSYLIDRLQGTATAPATPIPPILVCEIDVPLAFTTGILHPRIYVTPALLDLLTPDEMMAVLCHEWAHILRRDTFWNWLVRLLRDVVWFLPGSHLAWQSMVASQDEACDAMAVTMTRQPLTLARALVKVASAKAHSEMPSLVAASPFALAGSAPSSRVEQMIRLHERAVAPRRLHAVGAFVLVLGMLVLSVLPALLGS